MINTIKNIYYLRIDITLDERMNMILDKRITVTMILDKRINMVLDKKLIW